MNDKFVLMSQPRTGSTIIWQSIQQYCANEVFSHKNYLDMNPKLAKERHKKPIEWINFHTEKINKNPSGVKILFAQMREESNLDKVLGDESLKKIIVYRRNITESAVSGQYARMTRQYMVESKRNFPKVPEKLSIKVLREFCEQSVKNLTYTRKKLKNQNYIELCYEDFVNSDMKLVPQEFEKVWNFLKIPKQNIKNVTFKKQAYEVLYRKWIKNYDEINKVLGKRYGFLFSREKPEVWKELEK